MTAHRARLLAWSLAGGAALFALAFVVLAVLTGFAIADDLGFPLFLSYSAVGALVVARRPQNPIGWLFLVEGLLVSITGFADAYVRYSLFAEPGSLPGGTWVAWTLEWIWVPVFITAPILFFVLFPDGRLPSGRWRPAMWLIGAMSVGLTAEAFVPGNLPGNYEDTLRSVHNPVGIDGAGAALDAITQVANLVGAALLIAAVVSFLLRFRASRGAQRHQLEWIAYTGVLWIVSLSIGDVLEARAVPESITSVFQVGPVALIPVVAGIAILRYRLYDIDVLINRTVVFGGLVGFITLVYVAIVAVIGGLVGAGTGWDAGLAVVATAVVAAAFQPVRLRMHKIARRVAYGPPRETEVGADVAVRCLGAFRVFRAGEPVPATAWQSKKARTLLKILVARRGRSTPRSVLMEALWPDEDAGKLGNRLSVALATVRSVLDPEKRHSPDWFVEGDKDAVRVNVLNLSVDVEEFLTLAARGIELSRQRSVEAGGVLCAAEAAYKGDFLEEDLYEDWAAPLRDEVRAAYIAVARTLAASAVDSDADGAARYYRRILEIDGWDERAHLGLVEALDRAGQHGEARRKYQAYVARMEEIDVAAASFPASETATPRRAVL